MVIKAEERSTDMKITVRALSIIAIAILAFASITFAQYGSSASYNLQWKVIESGGNEGDNITSTSYRLSSCIGQPTPVMSGPSSSASYDFYPGFRKIDLDLRYPFSWFTVMVEYAADYSFGLSWAAIDTTIEDGQGWGVWNYDIQYKIGTAGAWTDWLTDTELTNATFGPATPVVVTPGQTYHFRLRAQDKARNEPPWTTPWIDQDSTIVNYVIEFCVWTVAPGLATDAGNHATLQFYQDNPWTPTTVDLWEGACAQVWCVPNTEAEITGLSSASDGQERWAVNTATDDTLWTIDGSFTTRDVWYWHQLKPIIVLEGTDIDHTVFTINHSQFGPGHLESGLYGTWSEWSDYASLIQFIDSTTGVPVRRALPTDSTRFHNIVAFFNDTITYMAAGNLVTVQTNFGGNVSVDGAWYPSPYNTNWFELSTHTIAVNDTFVVSACEKWIFDYWEDAPAITDTSRNVTITSDSVFTAIFQHKLRFDVLNPTLAGTPAPSVGSYWLTEGDTVIGSMDTTGAVGYMLAGFTGTGSAPSGAGLNYWFILDDCSSIEWNWVPASTNLCTLWVFSPYGHPMPEGMWVVPCGTEITCSVEDSTFEDGEWRHCTGWVGDGTVVPATGTTNSVSVVVSGTGWLVWVWDGVVLMPLQIASSPSVHGPPNPPVGIHWYALGADVDAFVESNPDGDWWCIGYTGWGDIIPTSADSIHFTLTVPTLINWQWLFWDGPIDTLWVFSHHGSPLPSVGMHLYPEGTEITAYVETPVGVHYCSGWTGEGSVPASGSTNITTFILNEFSTLTWQWDDRFEVALAVMNPAGFGSPVPDVGVHYYPMFSTVAAYVTSPDGGYYCVGFNGFGDVPLFGYEDHIDVTLTVSSGIEWLWDNDVVSLVVTAPVYSDADPPIGTTYHPVGRHILATALESVIDSPTERHTLAGWVGDGTVVPATGDSNVAEFTMTANGTINWIYNDQYYLTLLHAGLPGVVEPDTLGVEGWYNQGDSAVLITDRVVYDGVIPYLFTEWTDGAAPIGDTYSESTFVVMNAAYEITANFARGINVQIVKAPFHETPGWIYVDGDTFYAGTYSGIWVLGSTHEIEVSDPDSTEFHKFEWNWWRDAHGAAINRLVAPVTDTIFYADYNEYWRIVLGKYPPDDTLGSLTYDATTVTGPASVRQELWWLDGSTHTFEVSDPDSSEFVKFIFDVWSDGETHWRHDPYGPVTGPDSIYAIYDKYYHCRVEKDPFQNHGNILVDGVWFYDVAAVDFWALDGENVQLGVSSYDTVGAYDSIYVFSNWETAEFDTIITYTILSVDTITAFYNGIEVILDIQLGSHGIFPNDSVVWLVNDGDSVNVGEVFTMPARDSIKVYNMSTINIDLGLNIFTIYDTTDHWIIDPHWNPSFWQDNNRFVLMAQFTDQSEPPVVWERPSDYIDYSITWARTTPRRFGPGGENIGDVTGENTEMLWFQFIAPTNSTNPTHTRCIVTRLSARPNLP
jgi:hypothetical protein